MTRRAAIAALVAFAALSQARGEWVTEVVTNRVEYDGVEWLQSDGRCLIDTGYEFDVPITETYCFKIKAPDTPTTWSRYWSGGYSDEYGFVHTALSSFGQGGNSSQFECIVSTRPYTKYTTANYSASKLLVCEMNAGSIIVNGSVYSISSTYSSNYEYIVSGNRIFLFGFAKLNLTSQSYSSSGTIFYYFRIVKSDIVVRDYIPVTANGVGYMYDLVDGKLYANAGTGAFTYGAVTGKVAYVSITTNRVYRAPAPMRSFDAAHPFNNLTARTRLGGTGNGEDGTTLRPTAHIAIKRNEEE